MKSLNKYPPVVIAGLNDASMSIVRSLGKRGIQIIGIYDDSAKKYYVQSKYCSQKIKGPLYDQSLIDILLNNIAKTLDSPAVLFCATDRTVLTVSEHEAQLRPFYKFVLPPYDVTNRQISKIGFHNFAVENSFFVPKTFFLQKGEGLAGILKDIQYPCIIKPEFREKTWYESVPTKVLYAETEQNLLSYVRKYPLERLSLIIQEWIEGGDEDVYFCLAYLNRNQEPLAICGGRKLRQYPRGTGSTSIAETVDLPEMNNEALRFLKKAGCIGFCSVEFKRSKQNGRFYITEPTIGRPDTQEGLLTSAGIDAPYIAYLDALEEDVSQIDAVYKKVIWINEPLEFYRLQNSFLDGGGLRGFVSKYKGDRRYALWDWRDPLPALSLLKEKMFKGFHKLLKG